MEIKRDYYLNKLIKGVVDGCNKYGKEHKKAGAQLLPLCIHFIKQDT